MPKELTQKDLSTRRLRSCVTAFPQAETGEHNPKCCRFPKPCSPYGTIEAYQAGNLTERDIEPPESAPVRFERATTPEMERPLMSRQPVYQAEQKVLRQHRVGHSFVSSMTEEVDKLAQLERGKQVHRLEAYVLQEHLADDIYVDSTKYTTPATWWDHFKETFQTSWWLGWLVKRRPAKYDHHVVHCGVQVERYASYPEADVAVPQLGRPVPFENVRRLTEGEIEDMELQKTLQAKRDEIDSEENMWVFLLIPETIDELVEHTGLPREHFQAMYDYDQDFGLNSKIYLIPEGVGYRYFNKE